MGDNDAKNEPEHLEMHFKADLTDLVQRFTEGRSVIVADPPYNGLPWVYSVESLDVVRRVMPEVADEQGVRFRSLYDTIPPGSAWNSKYFVDGVHIAGEHCKDVAKRMYDYMVDQGLLECPGATTTTTTTTS